MADKLDPYSEGFLRTCYEHGVPEDIACQMLVKAATNNARQPGNLPIGDVGRMALFGAGCRVAELVVEKQANVPEVPTPVVPTSTPGETEVQSSLRKGILKHPWSFKDNANFKAAWRNWVTPATPQWTPSIPSKPQGPSPFPPQK